MRYTPSVVTYLAPFEVFVFGSNTAGIHDWGEAHRAMQWGAQWQKHEGHWGQTYAIPVRTLRGPLPEREIQLNVDRFLVYAESRPELVFVVSEIGKDIGGTAGPKVIAPMFRAVKLDAKFIFTWYFHQNFEAPSAAVENPL